MFRDDRQIAAVCQAICARVRLGSLWTEDGPTERAKELLEQGGGSLSHGEQIMLFVAWTIWNSTSCRISLSEILDVLDRGNLTAVGEVLIAIAAGPEAIDAWLDQYPAAE